MKNRRISLLLCLCWLCACKAASPGQAQTLQQPGQNNVATYGGCDVFTAGDWYNRPIAALHPDRASAKYIKSVADAPKGTKGLYGYAGFKTNIAGESTPMLRIEPADTSKPLLSPTPWLAGFFIQEASDAHAIVVRETPPHCHLFELYGTKYDAQRGRLSAFTGYDWDLSRPLKLLPCCRPSATASGLPIFPGAAHFSELSRGGIDHALDIVLIAHTVCDLCFVAPADYTDFLCYDGPPGTDARFVLPYGARLRLKRDFDDSAFGPQAKALSAALKTYGAFLSDTAYSATKLFLDDDTGTWDQADVAALQAIDITKFEVMPLGAIRRVKAKCVEHQR